MNKIILKLAMMLINLTKYPMGSIEDVCIAYTYTNLDSLYEFEKKENISSLTKLGRTINNNIYSKSDAIKYIERVSEQYDKFKKIGIKDDDYIKMSDKVFGFNKTIFQKIKRLFFNISVGIMLRNYHKKYREIHIKEFYTING